MKVFTKENEKCEGKSTNFSWAIKAGFEYEYKRENFYWLCRSCHAKIDVTDKTRERMSQLNKGLPPKRRKQPIWCEVCNKKILRPYTYHKYCKGCRKEAHRKKWIEWHRKKRQERKRNS